MGLRADSLAGLQVGVACDWAGSVFLRELNGKGPWEPDLPGFWQAWPGHFFNFTYIPNSFLPCLLSLLFDSVFVAVIKFDFLFFLVYLFFY